MRIYIKLYAGLAKYMPDKKEDNPQDKPWIVDIDRNTTINDLIRKLALPQEKIKIIFLNNLHAGGDEILKDQDRLGIFPLVAGG